MNKITQQYQGSHADITAFRTDDGLEQFFVLVHADNLAARYSEQLNCVMEAVEGVLSSDALQGAAIVAERFLVSDAANQQADIAQAIASKPGVHGSWACIQQPPLDGSKLALWLYAVRGAEVSVHDNTASFRHNDYDHIWTMGMKHCEGTSFEQTDCVLQDYVATLSERDMTLADNCIRTWFYVRDVDTQYHGLVKARRELFLNYGLSADTHYIASTGIGGQPAEASAIVQMDAYAVKGLRADQQRYLCALTHLNRTIDYGVTFERGTLVDYENHSHIYISGTASINNRGEVVNVGDIHGQTLRMWENVEHLLAEGGATFSDLAYIIIYLRDMADYTLVESLFREKFPDTPYVITLAPVCRPAWLIEMECEAITTTPNGKI